MADGTTMKECEFEKECTKTFPSECPRESKEGCAFREFAILVRNQTLEDVLTHESRDVVTDVSGNTIYTILFTRLVALKMEVE